MCSRCLAATLDARVSSAAAAASPLLRCTPSPACSRSPVSPCRHFAARAQAHVSVQALTKNSKHGKAAACAAKALQRLAEQHEARDSAPESAALPSERLVREAEAEALASALADESDSVAQLAAVRAVATMVKDDPTSPPCGAAYLCPLCCVLEFSGHGLSRSSATVCRVLADAGAVAALVAMLRGATVDGRSDAAVALARLAANVDVRTRLWHAQAVPALVAALRELEPKGLEGAVVCLEKLVTVKGAAEQSMQDSVRCRLFCC